jgi:hypothetical protein
MKVYKSVYRVILVIMLILMVLVLPAPSALANSDGPQNPGSGTNVPGIGTVAWQNPGEIVTPGSPYATATLTQGSLYSNYLQGTQYGFNIPGDTTITGIEVRVNRRIDDHNANILDNQIRLVKAGVIVGENRANALVWPIAFTLATYGGPTDLWGTDWTPAEINSPDFGVVLAAYRSNSGGNLRQAVVDSMQITVYYGYPTATELECGDGTPTAYGDSLTCMVTVTSLSGELTPGGLVDWSTDGSGLFVPNPCTLEGTDGVASCQASYTPNAVGSGSHLLTAVYAGDDYFAPSSVSQAVEVITRPITVTADAQSKVYSDPDPGLTYQVTQGSLVFSDTFTGTLTRQPGEDAGQYEIWQGSLALPVNYDLTFVGAFLTIDKAEPTCLVTPYDVVYDGEAHTATGSCTGVYGEELSGLDLDGTMHTDAGTYTDPWTFTDQTGNYNDTAGTVEDTIAQAAPVCTVEGWSGEYDGDPHGASGECLGMNGEVLDGLDLGETYTDVPGGSANWTFVDVNGNYADASGSVQIIISKANPICTITPYDLAYDSVPHTAEGGCVGVNDELLEGLDLSGTTHTDIAVYPDDPWAFTDVTGNYNDQAGTVEDEITLRYVTVTADALSKTVGEPDPELTYQLTAGSLLEGDEFSGALTRTPGETPGKYDILMGSLSLPEYYQLYYIGADFTINYARILLPMIRR